MTTTGPRIPALSRFAPWPESRRQGRRAVIFELRASLVDPGKDRKFRFHPRQCGFSLGLTECHRDYSDKNRTSDLRVTFHRYRQGPRRHARWRPARRPPGIHPAQAGPTMRSRVRYHCWTGKGVEVRDCLSQQCARACDTTAGHLPPTTGHCSGHTAAAPRSPYVRYMYR
jgi:hypothetical protein